MNSIESQKGEIVMYQPDETTELFQTTRNNITLHIGNIFKEGELEDSAVRKESLLTAADGKKYKTKFYNLDVIISVGYRVKSIRGTKFRQWANSVLKQYLLRGYAVNQHIFDIEQKIAEQGLEIANLRDKVNFFVRSSLPPVEGIFYDGQIFDAYAQIISLIKQAKHSIVLIDNYINVDTLTMLSNRDTNVSATIYTRQLSQQQQLDVQRHNQQYPPIAINTCQHNHDRFLIIDDVAYLFGASLKDAGKKLFAYIRMQETSPADLLSMIR